MLCPSSPCSRLDGVVGCAPTGAPAAATTTLVLEFALAAHPLHRLDLVAQDDGVTVRSLLHDADTAGLGGRLLVAAASAAEDERETFSAVCTGAALSASRAFLNERGEVSQAVLEEGDDTRRLLEATLLPWFCHSLDRSGQYVPMASLLLDRTSLEGASEEDSWPDGLVGGLLPGPFRTTAAVRLSHLLVEPAQAGVRPHHLFITIDIEGAACGRG